MFEGAIFDVDGVLVESPHERAWRETLERLLAGEWADIAAQTSFRPGAFTTGVYMTLVSGKPRLAGATAALEHFGVPDVDRRAREYADLKQQQIVELIQAGEFEAFPDALRFILDVRDSGVRVAAASSSKNAGMFLERIRLDEFARSEGRVWGCVTDGMTLLDIFEADVCGRDFAHGKPDPEIFVTAARELGVDTGAAFVVEDAVSGIQAAKGGRMAGLGIARLDDEDLLARAGADLVVTSLDAVSRPALAEGRLARAAG